MKHGPLNPKPKARPRVRLITGGIHPEPGKPESVSPTPTGKRRRGRVERVFPDGGGLIKPNIAFSASDVDGAPVIARAIVSFVYVPNARTQGGVAKNVVVDVESTRKVMRFRD